LTNDPPEQAVPKGQEAKAPATSSPLAAPGSADTPGHPRRLGRRGRPGGLSGLGIRGIRGKRGRRGGLLALLVCAVIVMAGGATFWALSGRVIEAPDWLRDRIEARLVQAAPALRLQFGGVSAQVTGGIPRLRLRDVRIDTADGAPLAQLTDLEFGLAPAGLLRGRAQLSEVTLQGIFVTLRRDRDGRFGLALGTDSAGSAPDIPGVVQMIDDALSDPRLARLRAVSLGNLTLRYEDARARRGWTVDGGRLRLERDQGTLRLAGDLAVLGGSEGVATLALNVESLIGAGDVVFGLSFEDLSSRDIATQSAALAWLDALRAPISGALRGAVHADGSLGSLNATLQIGKGVLAPNDTVRPIPFSHARTYFTYSPDAQSLDFDEITITSDWGRARGEGRAVLGDMTDGFPESILGQVQLSDIHANPNGLFEVPLVLDGAEMDFRLDLAPFALTLGRLRLDDDSAPLLLSGRLAAEDAGWRAALDGRLSEVSSARVLELWPPAFKPLTRDWVARNVLGGQLHNAQLALRLDPGVRPLTYLSFGFDEAEVRYARNLPPVTGGQGQFTLNDRRLAVRVNAGRVTPPEGGAIDVAGSTVVIPDASLERAMAEVALRTRSSGDAALSLINIPPFSLLGKAGQSPGLARADVLEVRGALRIPLLRDLDAGDIDYDLTGVAQNVVSDTLVKGRVLRAPELEIAVDNARIRARGSGTLDGIALRGAWEQALDQPGAGSRVSGQVQLSQIFADTFGITLLQGMLSGAAWADATLDLQRGTAPVFALRSSLDGLGLRVPALDWSLGQGTRGTLEVAGALSQPPRIDRLRIEGAGLRADARITLRPDGTLERLVFDRLRVGGWLDAVVTLTGRGRGRAPGIALSGGTLDLRDLPVREASGRGGGQSGPLDVVLERLQISDGLALTAFRGEFTTRGGLGGDFTARMNGGEPVAGSVVSQGARPAVRIRAENAGRLLADAGLLKTAAGGALNLTLLPTGGAGTYDGALDISDVRLRNAPAIGALLDAISIVGLIDQLEGPGIFFQEVEARFRLTPEQVILTRSSATGPSMGISLDGYYTLANRNLDLQGVLSPIYLLNAIGSIFTRKGEGLIGFNFTIRGSADSPRVGVNPFSALTPGMFREIFRRPAPEPGN